MTEFILLPSIVRSLFSVWAVLICLVFIAEMIYSVTFFRIKHATGSFFIFLMPYAIFQICGEISDYYLFGNLAHAAEAVVKLPYFIYIIALLILSATAALRLFYSYRYSETHITPKSVKQASDNLPTGFVYYFSNGRIFLFNHKMNNLDIELFNHPLQSGVKFAARLAGNKIFETKDGAVYRFTENKLILKGNELYEIIAEDITELYRKNQRLHADNEALREINRRMREYGERIGDTVKREEILKAKVHIHDEMNRILLFIDNALRSDTAEKRERVLNELKANALLLCIEADENNENPLEDLYMLAQSIGITPHMNTTPQLNEKPMHTFIKTAQECMINAVKHADAKNFYITVTENESEITAVFKNDGKPPELPIKESGGLVHLRGRIERYGGSMKIEANPEFALTAVILK